MFVNLILSCGHVVYKVQYIPLEHKVGESSWCPICGLKGITEIEGPYQIEKEKGNG